MNGMSLHTYASYSTYMNKENVSSIIKQPITASTKAVEEDNRKVEQVNESRKASNEEVVTLYYNHQATQAMKSRVDTLYDSENAKDEEMLTYEDMRKFYIQKNREEYARNQNSKSSFEVWA